MFTRSPTADIGQSSRNGCEVACAAQIFHMAGIPLPGGSRRAFERLAGRTSGQFDISLGHIRILLEAGFELLALQKNPTLDRDFETYCNDIAEFLQETHTREQSYQIAAQYYEVMRQRALSALELMQRFPHTYTERLWIANWAELYQLMDAGYALICEIFTNNKTKSHAVVVVKSPPNGEYLIASPTMGNTSSIFALDELTMQFVDISDVEAYRPPLLY